VKSKGHAFPVAADKRAPSPHVDLPSLTCYKGLFCVLGSLGAYIRLPG